MTNLKRIENELRYAAENGCDYKLLLEAADALREARETIEEQNNGEKQKTVYVKLKAFATYETMKAFEMMLNEKTPDRVVVLPMNVEILNPQELEEIKVKILGE